jgi:hypothetical protein
MFSSWSRSWQLVKASWAVLQSDKELLWFPVISGITMLIITIVMLVPGVFVGISMAAVGTSEGVSQVAGFIGLFIFYLVTYTISIYFNTGLIGSAMIRLDGGDPTLSDGFRIANEKLGKIVVYAALSATIGMILRAIRERGILGQIAAGLFGMAWNLATFLVIPVLVAQDIGAWDAIKYSTNLLKKTWGEQITGGFSIGGIFFLGYLLLIFVGGFLVFALASATQSLAITGIGIVTIIFLMIALGILQGALSGIFQAALYRYAETGTAPDNFDIELIQGAFKPKKKRGI